MGSLINIAVKRDILFCSSLLPLVVVNWCLEAWMIKILTSQCEIYKFDKSFLVIPVFQDNMLTKHYVSLVWKCKR